jgi:hypothetical protein
MPVSDVTTDATIDIVAQPLVANWPGNVPIDALLINAPTPWLIGPTYREALVAANPTGGAGLASVDPSFGLATFAVELSEFMLALGDRST